MMVNLEVLPIEEKLLKLRDYVKVPLVLPASSKGFGVTPGPVGFSFDWMDAQQLKEAVHYFGGAFLGLNLPVGYQTAEVWNVVKGPSGAPGSWGKHTVYSREYNTGGPVVIAGDEETQMTWGAVYKYAFEAYLLVSNDVFTGATQIPGLIAGQLRRDFVKA